MGDWGLGPQDQLDAERKLSFEDRRRLVRELRLEAVRTSFADPSEKAVARDVEGTGNRASAKPSGDWTHSTSVTAGGDLQHNPTLSPTNGIYSNSWGSNRSSPRMHASAGPAVPVHTGIISPRSAPTEQSSGVSSNKVLGLLLQRELDSYDGWSSTARSRSNTGANSGDGGYSPRRQSTVSTGSSRASSIVSPRSQATHHVTHGQPEGVPPLSQLELFELETQLANANKDNAKVDGGVKNKNASEPRGKSDNDSRAFRASISSTGAASAVSAGTYLSSPVASNTVTANSFSPTAPAVMEIHHHHHHHYYDPSGAASPRNSAAAAASSSRPFPTSRVSALPGVKITSRQKRSASNGRPAQGEQAKIIRKAQELLDNAKRSAELKRGSSRASPAISNSASNGASQRGGRRRRSRLASIALDDIERERLARLAGNHQDTGKICDADIHQKRSNDELEGEGGEEEEEEEEDAGYDNDSEGSDEGEREHEQAEQVEPEQVSIDTEQVRRRSRFESEDLIRLAETMSPYIAGEEECLSPDQGFYDEDPVIVGPGGEEAAQGSVELRSGASDNDDQVPLAKVVEAEKSDSRKARLEGMLARANQATEDNSREVPFGIVLQSAASVRTLNVDKSSRLPKYASVRQDMSGPSRPPPQVQSDESKSGSRHVRSLSQGNDPGAQITQKKGDKGPIMMDGWLYKLSSRNRWMSKLGNDERKWKPRHFSLRGSSLSYTALTEEEILKRNASGKLLLPKRVLDLSMVEIETNPKRLGVTPTKHAMMVYIRNPVSRGVDERNQFFVCARSFKEIMGWYKAIVHNAVVLCQNPTPSLPPQDRTPLSRQQRLLRAEKKRLAALPKPKAPVPDQFYPLYKASATHYDILGLEPECTKREVTKAYHKLAQKMHPDKNPDSNPQDFAVVVAAYTVLKDQSLREKYDKGEKVKEVIRRGFDCTAYFVSESIFAEDGSKRRIPTKLSEAKVTLFSDGDVSTLYHQPAPGDDDEDDEPNAVPLKPNLAHCVELRYIQSVLFGRNEPLIFHNFLKPILASEDEDSPKDLEQLDSYIILKGSKLEFDFYFKLDTAEACKELLEGLRIVRCESSVVFAQTLAKLKEEGFD